MMAGRPNPGRGCLPPAPRVHRLAGSLLLLLLLAVPLVPRATEVPDPVLAAAVHGLAGGSFADRSQAIAALVQLADDRTVVILQALFDGRLYRHKELDRVVIAATAAEGFSLIDPVNGASLGEVGRRDVERIATNNALRRELRGAIARLSLSHEDLSVRRAAVNAMYRDLSPEVRELLRQAASSDADAKVREGVRGVLALMDLDSPDPGVRMAALENLRGNLRAEVRNRLDALLAEAPDGSPVEADPQVRKKAAEIRAGIETRVSFYGWLETVFFGISLGSVLLLAAIGLAITFGVMGVINMAHGELIMLGAYTTYVVQLLMPEHLGLSILVAIPAAFLVAGLFGILIERGVIQFLYGRPLETLLATFGISLILQQLVRSIFSPLNRSVATPEWMSGSLEINSALSLTYNRLYIVLFALLVFFALLLILKHTALGLKVRAVSQNRAMARAMGIRSHWIDALTFGLGSGIAGVAGVALSQLTNVGPNLGQAYIIDSFLVVVFGGVGSLWGTLVASLSLGVVNKFLEPYAGAVMAKVLVLVFIILFIQKRPRGLFPQKGRMAEN